NLGRIATLSDELHDDFDITNTIFVGIHYLDRFDRREKYHPDGKQHENYKKFLMNEVIPLIKEQLPINPLGENWALMGDSLAGTLAFLVATQNFNTFDYVIMQSPLVVESVIHAAEKLDLNDDFEIYNTLYLKLNYVGKTNDGKINFMKHNNS